MANTPISGLSTGSPVSGSDLFADVQSAGNGPVKVTAAQVKSFVGNSLTLTNPVIVGGSVTLGSWTAVFPATAGAIGEVLATNGSGNLYWTAGGGTVSNIDVSGGTTGLVFTNGPVTSTGVIVLSGILGVANGGTGASTWQGALVNLLPPTSGATASYALFNDGAGNFYWAAAGTGGGGGGSVVSVNASGGTTGLTFTGGPITTIGTLTLGGTLGVTNGGTGATTAAAGLNNLLPAQAGNNGKFLKTDGSGNVSWATAGGLPGGATTAVQYNNAGVFAGDATNFSYDSTTATLSLGDNAGLTGSIEFGRTGSAGVTTLQGGAAPSSWTMTLPTSSGVANQVLKTDGTGVTSWSPSTVTIGSTLISLGGTATTLAGLTSVTVTQDPTAALQLATKQYVDANSNPVNRLAPCNYVSTVDITPNGVQTVDGNSVVTGNRVLLTNNTTGSENGIWQVDTSGAWIRPTDAVTWNQIVAASVFILSGASNANTSWIQTAPAGGIMGVTTQNWLLQSALNSYTAGLGISIPLTNVISNTGVVVNSGGTTGLTYSFAPLTGTSTLGGTLAISNGGTGQTTAVAAINALLPAQATFGGRVLQTDGTNVSWVVPSADIVVDTTNIVGGADKRLGYNKAGKYGEATGITTDGAAALNLGTVSTTQGTLVLQNTTANSTTIASSNSSTVAWTMTLPPAVGTNGQVLSTDSSGNTSWISPLDVANSPVTNGSNGKIFYQNAGKLDQPTSISTNGIATITLGDQTAATAGALVIANAAGAGKEVTITSSASTTAAYSLTLPIDNGLNAQVLATDGNGVLSWVNQAANIIVNTTPITNGTNSTLFFDNAGKFGKVSDIKTDGVSTLFVGTSASNQGVITLANASNFSTSIKSSNSSTANWSLTLPVTAGTSGQVLITDGAGITSWVAPITVNTTAISGGGNGRILFDNSGAVGEASGITVSGTSSLNIGNTLNIGAQGSAQGSLILSNTASAFSTTIKSSNSSTAAWTMTLPVAAGTSGYVLATDGAGFTSWVAPITINSTPVGNPTAGQLLYTTPSNVVGQTPAISTDGFGTLVVGNSSFAGTIGLFNNFPNATLYLTSSASMTADVNFVFPKDNGTNHYVLETDGAGTTKWVANSPSIVVNSTSITGGTSGRLVFNNGNTFGEAASITTNGGNVLTVGRAGTNQGNLVLTNTAGVGLSTTIKSSNSATAAWSLTLPTSAGTTGQVLSTDGSGVTSWVSVGAPGGASSAVQYNFSGSFAGDANNFSYNSGNGALSLGSSSGLTGSLVLTKNSATGSVKIVDGGSATNWTLNLPTGPGTNGYVLQTNGFGVTSWVSPPTTIQAFATPITGGTAGSIPYNNSGIYAESNSQLFWDSANNRLGIGTNTPANTLTVVGGDALIRGITVGTGKNANPNCTALGVGALAATTTGQQNTGIGSNALNILTTGARNVAVGSSALSSQNTGGNSIGIGFSALTSVNADYCIGIGSNAAPSVGTRSTGIGFNTLLNATSASVDNIAIGYQSGRQITTGTNNTAVGNAAMGSATAHTGNNNTAIGYNAGSAMSGSASTNTAVGYNAAGVAASTMTGVGNTCIGVQAGGNLTGGNTNTFIGINSGLNVSSGTSNIILGGYTGLAAPISQIASNFIVLSDGAGTIGAYYQTTSLTSWVQRSNQTTWTSVSDQRIKENIVGLQPSLDIIRDLRPVEFDYKKDIEHGCAGNHDIGFIAQEYAKVLPEQVHEGDDGYLAISTNLVPYLVKAIQELSSKNEELEARLAKLESTAQ